MLQRQEKIPPLERLLGRRKRKARVLTPDEIRDRMDAIAALPPPRS